MTRGSVLVGLAGSVLMLSGAARAQFGIPQTSPGRAKPPVVQAPPIEWIDSYEEAQARAKKAGRPIFLFFHGALKGARVLEVGTVNTPDVQLRAHRFVCVQVDPEKDLDLAQKLGITMNQGVLFADAEGKVLAKLEGNPPPDQIAAAMDGVVRSFGPIPSDADLTALDKMQAKAAQLQESGQIGAALRVLTQMARTGARCEAVLSAKADAEKMEADGEKLLAEAQKLVDGGNARGGAAALRAVANKYDGTGIGRRATDALRKVISGPPSAGTMSPEAIEKRLRSLWYTVQAAKNRGRLDDETDELRKIVAIASGADRTRAEERLKEIDADPELKAKRHLQLAEREARAVLARGKLWLRMKPEQGTRILRELIEKFPGTRQAREAEALLGTAAK